MNGATTAGYGILFRVFSLKDNPWLRFFRVPNLTTVPGDALAGAAFMMPTGDATLPQAFAAAVGVLFMYMFGLADNGVVGIRTDAENAPDRQIPRGEISQPVALVAMFVCLIAAFFLPNWILELVSPGTRMPFVWTASMTMLLGCVCAYNRLKWPCLMGGCRGFSVLCGGMATWITDFHPYTREMLPESVWLLVSLSVMVGGWTAYIQSVAKLSEGAESPSEGLGNRRFLLGPSAFMPLLAFAVIAIAPGMTYASGISLVLPVAGCCCTFMAWCFAVDPLWMAHGPAERCRAVEKTIDALIYLQIGFMLIVPRPSFLAAATGLWLANRLIRRLVPHVSGL